MDNNNKINELLKSFTSLKGEELNKKIDGEEVNNILNKLKPEDAQKMKQILSDPKATEKILSTQRAQAIMNKLLGKSK